MAMLAFWVAVVAMAVQAADESVGVCWRVKGGRPPVQVRLRLVPARVRDSEIGEGGVRTRGAWATEWMGRAEAVKLTEPCNWAGVPSTAEWSGPALATGAPGERGPSVGPVVWMTSKLVMLMVVRSSKTLAGQRSSGVTEMEKKFPSTAEWSGPALATGAPGERGPG